MSGFVSRRRHAVVAVAFAVAISSSAGAAESNPPDALEKVRKELEAAKTSRVPAMQPGLALPTSALPDWTGGTTPPPSSGTAIKRAARDAKSANWLVEAMNRQPAPRVTGEAGVEQREEDASPSFGVGTAKTGTHAGTDEMRAPTSESRESKRTPGQPAAPDPFARFLGEWMTPQDYALLKSSAWNESLPRAELHGLGGASPGREVATPELSVALAAIAGTRPPGKSIAPVAPRGNPYLSPLAAPASSANALPSVPKPVASSGLSPSGAPNVSGVMPVVPAQPKAPDFTKPSDDEKYFKQLKRF